MTKDGRDIKRKSFSWKKWKFCWIIAFRFLFCDKW